MFFLMSLFVCCCAFTQSAFIIEDFNYRDELHVNWRVQENERMNGVNPQVSIILTSALEHNQYIIG
ncbi:hypothetical protein ANCCAN_10820 [Ancylostoma caninum]|uniref:Uncharacterized protein n=1 Tax=Ancylostoma caninum TaxID=29170 RepID=A0A368GJS6_ANCCA|nr:hypothetical protein ANCCAN_10820 [Ancylostoma caninum]